MENKEIFVIGIALALLSILCLALMKFSAEDEDPQERVEEKIKFQPRKVSYTTSSDGSETPPKRKYKKKKKKKPAVAQNATVEKRPVGRPKKSN